MNTDGDSTNKRMATEFLQMVIAGQIDEAYLKHVDPRGKHHNSFYPAGFAALQKGMAENHAQFPNKKFTVKHLLGDGDLVVVHSHLELNPGKEFVVVHLLRFKDNKIIEMWDCGQPMPERSPNDDGAF